MTDTVAFNQLLYPYTRQIAANKTFLTRLWRLENDKHPGFMIGETDDILSDLTL